MSKIRTLSGFLHPFHFNLNHLIGEMIAPGIVLVDNERYGLADTAFYTDEKVHLYLRQDFYESDSARIARIAAEEDARKAYELQRQRERDEAVQRLQAAIDTFHESYDIPVEYSIRIKPVLSGLSASSDGTGANRRTVFHLFVEEPLKGRLQRAAKSFLCTPNDHGEWTYLDNDAYSANSVVTCKRCLALMERWKKVE